MSSLNDSGEGKNASNDFDEGTSILESIVNWEINFSLIHASYIGSYYYEDHLVTKRESPRNKMPFKYANLTIYFDRVNGYLISKYYYAIKKFNLSI